MTVRCHDITWTDAGLLSIELLGTSYSEIWIRILAIIFIQEKWFENAIYQGGGDEDQKRII